MKRLNFNIQDYKKITVIPLEGTGIVTVVVAYLYYVITVVRGDMSLDGDVHGTVIVCNEYCANTGYDDCYISEVLRSQFGWDEDDLQDLQNIIMSAVKGYEDETV
jgi:hypothetical protein